MNEQKAKQQGLVYHGAYSRDKDEVKARAAQLRTAGYRAVVVDVPDSKYSRSSYIGNGYSVYVEPKFFQDKEALRLQNRRDGHAARLEALRTAYEAKVAEEDAEYQKDGQWLTDNGYQVWVASGTR